jgi:carbamoyltransferase
MSVLSIHSMGHDTGVCVWEGGRLTFALETERLTRRKHDHRVERVLQHAIDAGALDPARVELVAVSTNVRASLLRVPDLEAAMERIRGGAPHHATTCELLGRRTPCLVVAHEASHAALALHFGGYADGTLVLVNEGRGSASRSSLFRHAGGKLEWAERDPLPWYGNGFGWSALAELFGFGKGPSVAGKLMAVGGYGAPSPAARELLLRADGRMQDDLSVRESEGRRLMARPEFRGGFQETAGVVATFQELFSETVWELVSRRMGELGCTGLALGGGCALNLNANTVLRTRLGRDVAIAPACNDAGQALGAGVYALAFWRGETPAPFGVYANGWAEGAHEYAEALRAAGLRPSAYDEAEVAEALAGGAVVAMVDGAGEIGPRALGHRSLLANPAAPGMRERLSERLKEREWFRPLGAVMRAARFAELYPGEHPSPYMLFTFPAPGGIPGATHVDGSSRVQTLEHAAHPRLHSLLDAFERASGVPALINTSLNRREHAIAHTARDAVDDFAGRDVDLFVFGDLMARNRGSHGDTEARR